jgi:hypothetical protein
MGGVSREAVIRVLGWIMIIFVLPNLILWLAIWHFTRTGTVPIQVPEKCVDCKNLLQVPKAPSAGSIKIHKPGQTGLQEQSDPHQHQEGQSSAEQQGRLDSNSNSNMNLSNKPWLAAKQHDVLSPQQLFDANVCQYLALVRYTASRNNLTDISGLRFDQLSFRIEQLSAMIHFLTTDGKRYFDRTERHTLKEQLKNQCMLLKTLKEVKLQAQNATFHRFNSRLAELKSRQQRLTSEVVD